MGNTDATAATGQSGPGQIGFGESAGESADRYKGGSVASPRHQSTEMAPRVRSNRVTFTINNYDENYAEDWEDYVERNRQRIVFLVVGVEIGANGTPHLQGMVHLKEDPKSCGITFWRAEIPGGQRAHFENARGTDAQNLEYCTKSGPYLAVGEASEKSTSKWELILELAKEDLAAAMAVDAEVAIKNYNQLKQIYEDHNKPQMESSLPNLRDWQKQVVEKLDNQGQRKILFVVDEQGGKGKSVLARHLMTTRKAWACQGGKVGDLMFAYDTSAEIAIFDMARCNNPDYYPWNFMENIKSGWFCGTKYKGGLKIFNIPKVVVFMNEEPPRNKLSADRYDVFII